MLAEQFSSADTMLAGGLNRYAYVAGNPETRTDPTGHTLRASTPTTHGYRPQTAYSQWLAQPQQHTYDSSINTFWGDTAQFFLGTNTLRQSFHTLFQDPQASTGDKLKAAGAAVLTVGADLVTIGSMLEGDPEVGEAVQTGDAGLLAAGDAGHVATAAAGEVTDVTTAMVGAGNNETVDLYRAVGVREYNSVMESGRFEPGANSLEAPVRLKH